LEETILNLILIISTFLNKTKHFHDRKKRAITKGHNIITARMKERQKERERGKDRKRDKGIERERGKGRT
jgi:hypothetical protein